jgi:hypothetical protein
MIARPKDDADSAVPALHLSVEDQRPFAAMRLNPPPLAPAMERACEIHRRLALGAGRWPPARTRNRAGNM